MGFTDTDIAVSAYTPDVIAGDFGLAGAESPVPLLSAVVADTWAHVDIAAHLPDVVNADTRWDIGLSDGRLLVRAPLPSITAATLELIGAGAHPPTLSAEIAHLWPQVNISTAAPTVRAGDYGWIFNLSATMPRSVAGDFNVLLEAHTPRFTSYYSNSWDVSIAATAPECLGGGIILEAATPKPTMQVEVQGEEVWNVEANLWHPLPQSLDAEMISGRVFSFSDKALPPKIVKRDFIYGRVFSLAGTISAPRLVAADITSNSFHDVFLSPESPRISSDIYEMFGAFECSTTHPYIRATLLVGGIYNLTVNKSPRPILKSHIGASNDGSQDVRATVPHISAAVSSNVEWGVKCTAFVPDIRKVAAVSAKQGRAYSGE